MGIGAQAYRNDEHGLALEFPSEWSVMTDHMGAALTAVAPVDDDSFAPSVNVVVEKLPDGLSVSDAAAMALSQMEFLLTGFRLLDAEEVGNGGDSEIHLLAVHQMGPNSLTFDQWFLQHNGSLITLTGTSTTEQHPQLHATWRNVRESLVLDDGG